ncbi:MAG: ACP synthase [Thomasclavelia ramosa]
MISGIGCDIVDLNRLNLDNECFCFKTINKNEFLILKIKFFKTKKEFWVDVLLPRSFFKAHGIEHGMLSFHDIEILNDKNGKPKINYPNTFISIAHENDYAIAYVVVEEG